VRAGSRGAAGAVGWQPGPRALLLGRRAPRAAGIRCRQASDGSLGCPASELTAGRLPGYELAVTSLTVWTNHRFNAAQEERLRRATSAKLVFQPGGADASELKDADVAFGQPPLAGVLASPRVRWVQLSSAGYSSYDQSETRRVFAARGAVLTKSSFVYASPCAEHVLAFMLCWARRLPWALRTQWGDRSWPQGELREQSALLEHQRVMLFGLGSIGARLVELLRPFTSQLLGVRRRLRGDEPIPTLRFEDAALPEELGRADHVVNLLPGADETRLYFDAARLSLLKSSAVFYNVGRGSTVDQRALAALLTEGRLQAALLDVTDPEPLPPEHPLWTTQNCFVTPHSAGGHHDEGDRLVDHFIANLRRFERSEPVLDRAF
jgi:phosphoglycerate dehydrogenase-like enzyme